MTLFMLYSVISLIIGCSSITCHIENEIVYDYSIAANLNSNGWTRCYFKPYNDKTTINALTSLCPTGPDYYLFVGAMRTSSSLTVYIGAMGPSQILTRFTSPEAIAYKPQPFSSEHTSYNVYWSNYHDEEFGFAPTPDFFWQNDEILWWYTSGDFGSYNEGFLYTQSNRSGWHKVIYYKDCGPTNSPTRVPTESTRMPSISPTHTGTLKTDDMMESDTADTVFIVITILLSFILLAIIFVGWTIIRYRRKGAKSLKQVNDDDTPPPQPSAPILGDDEEQIELTGFGYCIICCDNVANMFNDPCGHVTYCNRCGDQALSSDDKCSICRQKVAQCKQIYGGGFKS